MSADITSGAAGSETLPILLRALKLPTFAAHHEQEARNAEAEGWAFTAYLRRLVELELGERKNRRIDRLLRGSGLPAEKTLSALRMDKLPTKVRRQLPALCEGGFVDRAENVLAFGLPGRGKTHLVCAIGHELIRRGYSVLFISTVLLVQRLLLAKKELELEKELKRLDGYAQSFSMTSGTSSRIATRWKCSSPFSPSDTSDGAC